MASTALENQLETLPESPCSEELSSSAEATKTSYRQILHSSALIGGSQVLNIFLNMFRSKVMALLLGPGGFGLASLYNSIVELSQNIAGIGVNSSGVRQIAEAVGSADDQRVALSVAVLRRTSITLGAIGSLLLVLLRKQISSLTFGSDKYAWAVSLLSIAVFCKLVAGGQSALIQGTRRIRDLAKINVLGALFGAIAGIALIYAFRESGIVPYVIAGAATAVLTSWWYSRKVKIKVPRVSATQVIHEANALLKLGFAFMISSLMTLGVAYAIRVIVLRKLGLHATGLYQSAWTLGGMYVGFILQAMAADFYPRLTANVNDHVTCNRLVNEQARVGLLLAAPGVIATLTFAHAVVSLLYSAKFVAAVPVLQWICLGALLQVISFPMGFIIVAKGKQNLFIFSEVSWAVASLALAWPCITRFGVTGAGICFCASYVFHVLFTYVLVSRLTGFSWSSQNLRIGIPFLLVVIAAFWSNYALRPELAIPVGTLGFLATGIYSIRHLLSVVSPEVIPSQVRRLLMIASPQA